MDIAQALAAELQRTPREQRIKVVSSATPRTRHINRQEHIQRAAQRMRERAANRSSGHSRHVLDDVAIPRWLEEMNERNSYANFFANSIPSQIPDNQPLIVPEIQREPTTNELREVSTQLRRHHQWLKVVALVGFLGAAIRGGEWLYEPNRIHKIKDTTAISAPIERTYEIQKVQESLVNAPVIVYDSRGSLAVSTTNKQYSVAPESIYETGIYPIFRDEGNGLLVRLSHPFSTRGPLVSLEKLLSGDCQECNVMKKPVDERIKQEVLDSFSHGYLAILGETDIDTTVRQYSQKARNYYLPNGERASLAKVLSHGT